MEPEESSRQVIQVQPVSSPEPQASPQSTPARSDSRPKQSSKGILLISSGIILIAISFLLSLNTQTEEVFPAQIPRKLWVYSAGQQDQEDMPPWLVDNLKEFAEKVEFSVQKITMANYGQFVSQSAKDGLSTLTEKINQTIGSRINQTDSISIEGHLLLRQLIALAVLLEHGGVIMTDDLVLTEDITWIDRVYSNPYVIRKDKNRTEVVGFFDPRFSHPKHRQDSEDPIHAPYKYLWRAPALSCSFLASIPNSQFINKLVEEVTQTLENFETKVQQLHSFAQKREGYQLFTGISRIVFEERARQLKDNQLPVDSYSISLINLFYGPAKTLQQFKQLDSDRLLHYLTNLSQEQLVTYLGPLPYAQFLPLKLKPQTFTQMQKRGRFIMEGSFFAKLFPETFARKLYANPQHGIINGSAPRWQKLPKKIWMIWISGLETAPLIDQIGYAVAKKVAKRSGFQINLVDLKNIYKFIDSQTYSKLARVVNDHTHQRHHTTGPDLLRLALLYKHGGVYMDTSTILRGDLQWLLDVGKFPSQYVYNRYGEVPRMLTMFYAFSGGPGRWVVDPMYNTKTFRHIGLENSFIAVEKGHQLIRQWLDLTIQLLSMPYAEVVSTFDSCGVIENRYVSDGTTYAMPMESVSCVVGRRQDQLLKQNNRDWVNAYHYYGYWQLNGFLGAQKYRLYQNLEGLEMSNNPFFTEYSEEYVNGLIGKPLTPYTKMVHFETQRLEQKLSDPAYKVHPESFLARALGQNRLQLRMVNGKIDVLH